MARPTRWRLVAALAVVALVGAACSSDSNDSSNDGDNGSNSQSGSKLDAIKSAGKLVCGVNDAVPGFGFVGEDGSYSGFDIDICRAIAAGILGDATAVEFKALTATQRFTALQSGDIDVLSRNTTWTASRDGTEGAAFATTTFYDGQGMLVNADSSFNELSDMSDTTICVLQGTTTELNLTATFQSRGIAFQSQTFEDNDLLREAFIAGQCDGWTSDKSQLAGIRSAWPEANGGPDALRVLDETFSKEPLGPLVLDGDSKLFDAVNWSVLALIQAEEFGITSDNIDSFMDTTDPAIQTFLGLPTGEESKVVDPGLGLPTDFAATIIKAVGNYGEIYDRNVGPDTALGLARGLNALWTDGGLLYAPPYK